jgi:lysophospholipase L1-like esterase
MLGAHNSESATERSHSRVWKKAAALFVLSAVATVLAVHPPHARPSEAQSINDLPQNKTTSLVLPAWASMGRWAAFGDSITEGVGASNPKSTSYVALLSQAMQRPIENHGVGGTMLGEGEKNQLEVMQQHFSDGHRNQATILQGGLNDIRKGRDMDAMRKDIRELIQLSSSNSDYVFIGTPLTLHESAYTNPLYTPYDQGSLEELRAWEQVLREEVGAGPSNVYIIDTSAYRLDFSTTGDTIHPNDSGMKELSEIYSSQIDPIVNQWRLSRDLQSPLPDAQQSPTLAP